MRVEYRETVQAYLLPLVSLSGLAILAAAIGLAISSAVLAQAQGEITGGDRLIGILLLVGLACVWLSSFFCSWAAASRQRVAVDDQGFTPPIRKVLRRIVPKRIPWDDVDWVEIQRNGTNVRGWSCLVHRRQGRWYAFGIWVFPSGDRGSVVELLLPLAERTSLRGGNQPLGRRFKMIHT